QDPEVRKHAAQILRNMLRQEEAELQRLHELCSRNPGSALEEQLEGTRRRISQLQLKILQENPALPVFRIPGIGPGTASGSPSPAPAGESGNAGILPLPAGPERAERPLIIGPEEDCDPGYPNHESDSLFQDLGMLKSRPAHLGVFLRFILSQADPGPLLFHLCADVFLQTNPKDSRALGRDIWNIFLDRNA
ncbi:ARHGB factor, partial [Atrichornis clamosus]|nr:ARHGB factor [Atrichornis clamosus]